MKRIEKISEGENYSAVTVGAWDALDDFALQAGPGVVIPGKVFAGEELKATGAQVSWQRFEPGSETGFLHTHRTHEELYLFVQGEGEFQVDGRVFRVGEGSAVRVAPAGRRSVRNNGSGPLVMICVQYRAATFDKRDAGDGQILGDPVVW